MKVILFSSFIRSFQLLETQQELAVAVSADRKKDVMINQLDKVQHNLHSEEH